MSMGCTVVGRLQSALCALRLKVVCYGFDELRTKEGATNTADPDCGAPCLRRRKIKYELPAFA